MPRMIEKFVALIQWLSAPEELPSRVAGVDPQGVLRSILTTETLSSPEPGLTVKPSHPPRFWRWILGDEELPVAEAADRDHASRTMFFTRLLEAERCPRHPGGAIEHREGFFRRLLAPEQCPSQPAPAPPAKRGFARWLLEQEECPVESLSPSVRHQGFWRNLLASEKL